MKNELPILFSPIQASKVLGISRTTLYEQMKLGHLKSVKIGRSRKFTQEHMKEFIFNLEQSDFDTVTHESFVDISQQGRTAS